VYDQWVAGELAWTSPEIKAAFETFGAALQDAHGGSNYIVTTNFGKAANPMFDDPPGCLLHHQASFITDFCKEQGGAADGEFDFFPMPDINSEFAGAFTGAGDLFGLFSDKAAAKDLLKYLTTAEAQQIWVDRGGALSGNTKVTKYPDDISQRSAEILTGAKIFRFDGGDLMPSALKADFFRAMVDYTEDPSQLDTILDRLDTTAESA
jgi:alpha-glucoside transport system substrate-binding protein